MTTKRKFNITLTKELGEFAQLHMPATVWGSLSGFLDAALEREMRKMAPKLKRAGYEVPEFIFDK